MESLCQGQRKWIPSVYSLLLKVRSLKTRDHCPSSAKDLVGDVLCLRCFIGDLSLIGKRSSEETLDGWIPVACTLGSSQKMDSCSLYAWKLLSLVFKS